MESTDIKKYIHFFEDTLRKNERAKEGYGQSLFTKEYADIVEGVLGVLREKDGSEPSNRYFIKYAIGGDEATFVKVLRLKDSEVSLSEIEKRITGEDENVRGFTVQIIDVQPLTGKG